MALEKGTSSAEHLARVLTDLPGSHKPRARLQDLSQLQISPVLGTRFINCDHSRSGKQLMALGREQEPPQGRAGCPGCVLGSEGMLRCLVLSPAQQNCPADGSFRASPHFALRRHGARGTGGKVFTAGWNLHCWNGGEK